MVDDVSNTRGEDSQFIYTRDDVLEWQEDQEILTLVQSKFKRLRRDAAKLVLSNIINHRDVYVELLTNGVRSFLRHNFKLFDITDNELNTQNEQHLKKIKLRLTETGRIRKELLNDIEEIINVRRGFDVDGQTKCWPLKKSILYEVVRKNMCDEAGNIIFYYDFDTPDMPVGEVYNGVGLQHTHIQILSQGAKFEYPLIYRYVCHQCDGTTTKKAYEVIGSRTNLLCRHPYTYTTASGDVKTRQCKTLVAPDKDVSTTYPAEFYDISYTKDGRKIVANAFTFKCYKPGYYECVMYRVPNVGKTEMFFIADVRQVPPAKLTLPEQSLEENYLFTLQKALDNYVLEKTNSEIYGMFPIKCALLLQLMIRVLDERLLFNVMVVGDPSTGKTMLLKYYSFLLHNYYNMSTNGLSVSVAGLRGTRSTISLFGKDIKIVTIGHLGTFHSIHIDEAGENSELVQNLKSFLLEDNYSYDRAGSLGISNKRTSHVNVSQNLDHEHVGQYRGAIRKAYKDLNMTIGGVEKDDWDEDWDLFLPIHMYDNPHLRKIVKEKRLEFKQKQTWWIDGLDYALHERFPFYFYLVNDKPCPELNDAVRRNARRRPITENLEVIRAVHTEDVDEFFKTVLPFQFSEEDPVAFVKVDEIIEQYGHIFDSRTKNIYYMIVRFSRAINKRMEYHKMDYDLVRWFLETTNIKLDVADAATYDIRGPPNIEGEVKRDVIEEESRSVDDMFGLQTGEFDK